MLLPLLGALSLLGATADTSRIRGLVATPTVNRTPVIRVASAITADSIVVEKGKRRLTLYQLGIPVRTYRIALGKQPVGDKLGIGDNRTPEGVFYIDFKKPESRFYKALHISYPDAAHAERARRAGVRPGGDIMIHGLPTQYATLGERHANYDWTEGCIAVTNEQIDEIWRAIPLGAAIEIKP